jgi:flagellar hook-length control protein FliK
MNWKIREEATPSPLGEEGRQWATQIHLDLPNLGEVTATLRFGSNGLTVTLDTDTSATRAKLGTASSTLVAALSERGITIASALVTQHDAPRQA